MKIGVVGVGFVGGACANGCVMRGVGSEMVLVDYNPDLALAQAEDIFHATPFAHSMNVRAGEYADLAGCGVVMVAAGVNQKPGETRLDLLKRNADIFKAILPQVIKAAPEAVLLIATNPVDIMTHIATDIVREHGGDGSKVLGSGTMLDTARYRALLSQHLGVSSHSIHAYVLGEHGDSEVLHWSGASVGNIPLLSFAKDIGRPIDDAIKAQIDDGVRHAAARIIKGKGATFFGIGAGMARLARAVINNENALLTCTSCHEDIVGVHHVSLSLPSVVNENGVARVLHPPLDGAEVKALAGSASVLRGAADALLK